ncbi:MAG: hypothetical protein NT145_08450 [Elusimicrobia bacterium]|nr:hypothetical protein [Elusimicrobiota bacterium]
MKKLFILILSVSLFSGVSFAYAGSGSSCGVSSGESSSAPAKPVKKAKSVKKVKAAKPVVKTESVPAPAAK